MLRAKPCFCFDPRYLRQLHHLLQGILCNKHHDTVNISCQEKKKHFKEAPLTNGHSGAELDGCCMVVLVTLKEVQLRHFGLF